MTSLRQSVRKIKVLGYPYASGKYNKGTTSTPQWLQDQHWFKNLAATYKIPIEYEEISASRPDSIRFTRKYSAQGPTAFSSEDEQIDELSDGVSKHDAMQIADNLRR